MLFRSFFFSFLAVTSLMGLESPNSWGKYAESSSPTFMGPVNFPSVPNSWLAGLFELSLTSSVLTGSVIFLVGCYLSMTVSVLRRWLTRKRSSSVWREKCIVGRDGVFWICCLPLNCFLIFNDFLSHLFPNRPKKAE